MIRNNGHVGFAVVYLNRCKKESDSIEKVDINVYKQLVELDTKLGTTGSEQLHSCLLNTTRCDIIKVRFYYLNTYILDNDLRL